MDIERLYRKHKRIESETTGTPEEFAKEFNMKKRQMQNQLEEFRLWGAVINYCRKRKTYYYVKTFDFFEHIDTQHLMKTIPKKTMRELFISALERKLKNDYNAQFCPHCRCKL